MGDMKAGRQWTNEDVRGFKPVPTHKHCLQTCFPPIFTHTRRITYARRLMNNAHRCTVVRLNFFNCSKLKITHKQPWTHINLQSLSPRLIRWRITHIIWHTLHAETKICAKFVRDSCVFALWLALNVNSWICHWLRQCFDQAGNNTSGSFKSNISSNYLTWLASLYSKKQSNHFLFISAMSVFIGKIWFLLLFNESSCLQCIECF